MSVTTMRPHNPVRFAKNERGATRTGENHARNSEARVRLRHEAVQEVDRIDSVFGFDRYSSGAKRVGWLVNMHPTTLPTTENLAGCSGVDYYFLDEEGGSFKASVQYDPYFLLMVQADRATEVEEYLRKFLEGTLKKLSWVEKEDLALTNHLIGLKRQLLQLSFHNVSDLLEARRQLQPIIQHNRSTKSSKDIYQSVNLNYNTFLRHDDGREEAERKVGNITDLIEDIREYDVPYHVRVSIDCNIRVGKWYTVEADQGKVKLEERADKLAFADPVVLAFDIETTKAPLKFPDSSVDQIMMISYMIDGEGYLITNREIISEDIEDFEYTPKPEYPGYFAIFNEPSERHVIQRFFEHVRDARPTVIATFNGDFFDWPFVEARAAYHDIDMYKEIGFAKDSEGEYKSTYCVHMDCFRWVKRDSYLPQGSQGLKAVTTVKLGYNPTELDPELMTPYAYEKPQLLAEYSVSDAVATYYLYYKYVHPFIFSLCTIIPLNPDEVLRKGTGTLCEMLLMVQAYQNGILLPNKHTDPLERFYEGHLLESETYVGGHVESLEAGVFRADLATDFSIDPAAVDEILNDLDSALKFSITVEEKKKLEDVTNYDEVCAEIRAKLTELKTNNKRTETPLIYHVDVASMYPNIMTTNRLQPDSMKTEKDCASCDFNRPGKTCDRRLPWAWRGEFYPAEANEYNMIKNALKNEQFAPKQPGLPRRTFEELSYTEQVAHIKKRVSDYSRKVYHRIKATETVEREAIICQRENPFYVNTVRDFRDRRYEFKGLAKAWKGKVAQIGKEDKHAADEAKKMVVLYDSLQLAHKVILNSFYGYVMRKGSRWYSMEMAGVTCLTGATIIQMARSLVERLGRPLELDTDGIWCILPSSFPEDFKFTLKSGKSFTVSYPCSMLNYLVHQRFTNHQYQMLVDPVRLKYETVSDNSIFFEVDGPYKAMVLPTSKEEGKGLKKRYAVFNFDGSLAELKGFELKRRGELQLIKNFQSDIFKLFLEGDSLEGCYQAVANIANRWLDVLDSRGRMLEDEDLIELICENRSMSKTLEEYAGQKSTSITTARRLGEFLGEEMVKDKGLACKYVIADRPIDAPITERAIPTAIFSSDIAVKRKYLRRWLVDPSLEDLDPRSIIDWDYYKERLASVIQKIITIPAALQGVSNPVPRVSHPDWLQKRIDTKEDKMKQSSLSAFLKKGVMSDVTNRVQDIEDLGAEVARPKVGKVTCRKRKLARETLEESQQQLANRPCPDPLADYAGFLQYQKLKWEVQVKERERRKRLFGKTAQLGSRMSVANMVRKQAENYVESTWQVLQYCESTEQPGDLKAYVLINGKIHTLTLHVAKKLYLDFKSEPFPDTVLESCEVTRAAELLPSGQKSANLFKLVMSHDVYSREIAKTNGLLNSPHVAGIYETQIQSAERAIIELGSCVKFDNSRPGDLGRSLEKGFDLKLLRPVAAETYLSEFTTGVLYLLHVSSNSYEIFTLFNPADSSAHVYVLKPTATAQQLPANVDSLYADIFASKKDTLPPNLISYEDQMKFETHYFTDALKLYKKLNSKLLTLDEHSASKSLLVVQSPYSSKIARHLAAAAQFPCVRMGTGQIHVNSLSWHSLIMKRIINHYLSLAGWLQKIISLARYSNIPLCNLEIDNLGYMIDIEYARKLSQANIVLWWSPSPNPDLGGVEKDAFAVDESFEFPVINQPEVYESVCLELELKNLTINTVLTSSLINEAEGVFSSTDAAAEGAFAEDSFSGPALVVLRSLVRTWWDDAIKNNSEADSMVHGFVSWCQNPASFLYDSSLHYHVHNLTKKSFIQLLGEFKKMGSAVVFADRNRVVVETSKTAVENSYAYSQYILTSVRASPLFNYLDLQVVKYWDLLVWMDKYNYMGRFCYQVQEAEVQKLEAVSDWQLKKYLPPILHSEFEEWTWLILDSLIKHRDGRLKNLSQSTQLTPDRKAALKKITDQKDEDALETVANGVCELFRAPLLKRLHTLIKKQNEVGLDPGIMEQYQFPVLPGSHLEMSNPTLELSKYLCHILGLSKKRNIEVRLLRKEILSLFEIKEFSDEGVFKNPAASLVLPHVICSYCNYIKDVDVCRDEPHVLWHCEECNKPYNKLLLEERLISEFNRLLFRFLTQDLKCAKCGKIKDREIMAHCSCSGTWTQTISRKDVAAQLRLYRNVALAHDLKLLLEIAEETV
ncbi:hypothetical protein KL911_002778 [Ogataea haglerorum]|uniref:uncharacterized protein n=1 Tax=Ogataea haglerorum TaxID=1937702 RepID=UPI001C897985|nr:uncharacterized protein KL911_002778 [Ogataea haglerorum]KAG7753385.1 hypothetical protein KL911_002778 [Ogataea haglerorum]KAG7768509.1 hypothetical protein KL931_003115 [Ogataea haglerorum]KAG7809814.1 hypothetical protein KL924_002776 [Ogataea haglerorum]